MERFDKQKYFDLESQRKILYVPNLSNYMDKLHQQILKLPHEINPESENIGAGTTYEDIMQSVINGISLAYDICAPYINDYGEEISRVYGDANPNPKNFQEARELLRWLYLLLDHANALNDKMVEMELPDNKNEQEEDADEFPQSDGGDLPAHQPKADDKEVGYLEKKDKK